MPLESPVSQLGHLILKIDDFWTNGNPRGSNMKKIEEPRKSTLGLTKVDHKHHRQSLECGPGVFDENASFPEARGDPRAVLIVKSVHYQPVDAAHPVGSQKEQGDEAEEFERGRVHVDPVSIFDGPPNLHPVVV